MDVALYLNGLKELTEAVKASSDKSIWWDIVVPLCLAGVVAGLTAFITYLLTKRLNNKVLAAQEAHHNETLVIQRENLNREAINEVLLLANSCLTSLIAIKDNYRERLSSKLAERLIAVPVIKATSFHEISYEVLQKLFFVTPNEGDEMHKWGQVTQIEGMFSNYNSLMSLWAERNAHMQVFQTHLINGGLNSTPDLVEIGKFVHIVEIQRMIQLTEYCLSLTDDMCKELDDFIMNFENAYKDKLNSEVPKKLLIRLFNFSEESCAARRKFFAPGVEPDFSEIANKFATPEEFEIFKSVCKSVYRQS